LPAFLLSGLADDAGFVHMNDRAIGKYFARPPNTLAFATDYATLSPTDGRDKRLERHGRRPA